MLKTTKAQLQNLSSWLLSRRAANDCLKTLTPAAGASCGVRTFLNTKTPFFYGQIEFMHVLIFQMLLTVLKVITVYLHRSLKNRIFGGCSSDSAFILRKWRFFITKNYELSKNNGSDVFLEALGPCVLCHRMHPHEIARLHVQRRVANLRRMY